MSNVESFMSGDPGGVICEAHPAREWPHDDCPGPGMPVPENDYPSMLMGNLAHSLDPESFVMIEAAVEKLIETGNPAHARGLICAVEHQMPTRRTAEEIAALTTKSGDGRQ